MKKNDVILILVLAVLALGGLIFYRIQAKEEPVEVMISIDGKEYRRLPLNKDQELEIPSADGGFNYLVIKNGIADVTDASCPDKVCVHQAAIHQNGELIVCLPNRVVITVISDQAAPLDGVAN